MRIWDLHPGYLNRGSLLGEHRELHGILAIIEQGKRGYARHPETLRWRKHLAALRLRHDILRAEMALRGYRDLTPVPRVRRASWPAIFIDSPAGQLSLLGRKYASREAGRIRLPRSNQELWASHKYSVLARDQAAYRAIGRSVSRLRRGSPLDALALELVELLRRPPAPGDLHNAILHMWGYVRSGAREPSFAALQRLVLESSEPYLTESTALSELAVWLGARSALR
jgi:uncharacterized protein YbgA (DUF1722 family)